MIDLSAAQFKQVGKLIEQGEQTQLENWYECLWVVVDG